MNFDALVTQGRPPWSPNPDAADLDVWDEYEVPRTGTFTVKDTAVLFTVLGDLQGQLSVWAYTVLSATEAREVAGRSFSSAIELRQFTEEMLVGRRLVLALADDFLINSWAVSDAENGVYEAATDFLDQVLRQSHGRLDASAAFRAKLAQVDVATHEFAEA